MSRFHNRNFELLEPYDAKVSRTVLRGEGSSNAPDLLDIFLDNPAETFQQFEKRTRNLQSLSRYSRANQINKEWLDQFLNEGHSRGLTPVRCHCNVLAWSDDAEQLKRIKSDVGSQLATMECKPRHNTVDVPALFWAGIPGNESDFPAEKTLITHGRKSAKFLGYEIYVRKSTQTKRNKAGKLTRPYNNKIYLKMPLETVRKKLLDYDALKINVHNGKEQYKSKHRTYLINNDDLEILERYNSEIRGFYNFYSLANNCHTLHSFKYIMEYSMYKTFAAKYKSTVVKICKKYKKDKVFTVYYKNNKGKTLMRQFYHDGFKRKKQDYAQCYDRMPTRYHSSPTSLVARLKACKCELCGKENVKLDMHHVRKLKNLQGKEDWEKHMIARKRKTIALCRSCHKKVDGGWMD